MNWVMTNGMPYLDSEGKVKGYRGSSLNINLQKSAFEALRQSEERYKSIFRNNHSVMMIIDPETGNIKDVNASACDYYKWTYTELCSKNIYEINVLTTEEIKAEMQKAKEETRTNFHFKHRLGNGDIRNVEVYSCPISFRDTTSLFSIVHDITDRIKAEESLKINEAALNQAQEISKMCSWELDLINEKLTWSNNYYHLMGITAGSEMNTQLFLERVHPEDIHLVDEKLEEMKRFKKPVNYDIRLLMPDNEYRWMQNNIVPEFEDGKLIRYKGVNIDVTEKKLAEQEIEQQNERLSAIINAIPDLIFVSDREGTYLEYYNTSNMDMLYSADKLIGSTVRDVFDEETANLHIRKINECLQTKNLVTFEYFIAKNGTNQYCEARLTPLGNDKVLRFVRDFTQENQKDAELKKLYLSIAQSPVITVITDLQANIEYVNPAFIHITGYNKEEVIGQNVRILQSGKTDKAIYKQLWETIKAGKEWHGEWINKKKNGELYWEDVRITPVRDDFEKITNYLAVKQDITQRKQIEQEILELNANLELNIVERTSELSLANYYLKDEIEERKRIEVALSKSEIKYTSMIANISDVIGIIGIDGVMNYKSPNITKYFGWKPEDLVGKNGLSTVHPDDLERVQKEFYNVVQKDNAATIIEYLYLCKDGSYKPIELTATNLINDKIINGVLLNYHDITARKLAEEELAQVSSRLSLALRIGGIGVWDLDVVNNVLLWDNQMFAIYGIRKDEFSSAYDAWLNGLHPDDKIWGDQEIQMAINGEKEFDTEFRVVWPDGSVHFVRALAAVERDHSGKALRVIGTNWDITPQKQAANFENEMLQLSTKLTGVTSVEIDSALKLALLRIGQFLNADRAYIFELNDTDVTMTNTYEWCNDGIHPEIENLQQIPCDVLPSWMETLRAHENIIIPSVQDLPESWQSEREILDSQGVQSLVVIPMLVENDMIGFVGLDSVKAKRDYNSSEINMLKVWSSMLASLIQNKRTEGLLEQTRQNYETFFNTIDDFLFILDKQGNIVDSNNTVKDRLGYSNAELTNKSVLMVRPPDRREEALCVMQEILEGKAQYCSIPLITKSGKQIPVETRINRGYWNGSPVIFGVSKDISQIRLSEQKFASAFQSNSAIMTITRFADDQFMDVNNAFVNTLGYSREDIKGQTLVTLGIVRENPGRETVQELINRGIPIRELEVNAYSKSNELFTFLLSAEEIYIGSERCILSVAVNITERKIMENELRKARKEADQANMAKSEFLSRMSHELRTPMNSILGFAQLLKMGELNARQSTGVNHIMKSGKHLLDLINEVLDISRIEAGHLSLSIEPVQLSGVISEMIDLVKLQIIERQIRIGLIDAESNRMFVKSDRKRLKQIILNLLNNAIKYNRESGSIWIKTELRSIYESGVTMLRISITDTGLGISEADLPKLFTPFERIGAEKSGTEGTGLGLSVVKKLIEAMSGNLGVESQPGTGSTFWIELPNSESPREHLEKSGILLNELEPKLTDLCGTILYIEDNASNIEFVEQILTNQRSGIKLIYNMTGAETVQLAIENLPDLILLDLNLPDMHGSKVLSLLLAEERTKNIPVVVISADAMPQQFARLLNAGARDYLTKPLDIQGFLLMIDKYIPHLM